MKSRILRYSSVGLLSILALSAIPLISTVAAKQPFQCGQTITKTVYLKFDVGPCNGPALILSGNGVTVHCNFHSITGTGSGVGVQLSPGSTDEGVHNCSITGFATGVSIPSGATGALIQRNFIYNNGVGLNVASSGNTIKANDFDNNAQYGIVDTSTGSNIAGTGNIYSTTKHPLHSNNECSGNGLGGSDPTGLCTPQA